MALVAAAAFSWCGSAAAHTNRNPPRIAFVSLGSARVFPPHTNPLLLVSRGSVRPHCEAFLWPKSSCAPFLDRIEMLIRPCRRQRRRVMLRETSHSEQAVPALLEIPRGLSEGAVARWPLGTPWSTGPPLGPAFAGSSFRLLCHPACEISSQLHSTLVIPMPEGILRSDCRAVPQCCPFSVRGGKAREGREEVTLSHTTGFQSFDEERLLANRRVS